MPFKDLREFIAKLEQEGEATRIEEEVDWDLEAGAMIRKSNEDRLPAPFFQKIKDYPSGYRMFGEVLGSHRRIAIAMDLAPDTPIAQLQDEYFRRKNLSLKPSLVKDGPCKEHVHIGDEVDLYEFPVPLVHEGDGGRYIGAWHLDITKDLDSGWVNWGMYRHMLHDRNTIALQTGPSSHISRMRANSWTPRNRPMEVAIVIGTEPISGLCAASPITFGVPEVDIVGGIRNEPVELVKCETVDLEVPATAEIVIEGEISLDELRDEGPFGEYTGYIAGHKEPRPVIHVKAVTHRENPILTTGCEGTPVTNSHVIMSVARAAELRELLMQQGLPVTQVSLPVETSNMLAVVAAKTPFMADEMASAIWGSRAGRFTPYVIVVEDDVDPFNFAQVMHALFSKCHPYRGISKQEYAAGNALLPYLTQHEQKNLLGAKVLFDCSWPRDWQPSDIPKKASFSAVYPPEVQTTASEKWDRVQKTE